MTEENKQAKKSPLWKDFFKYFWFHLSLLGVFAVSFLIGWTQWGPLSGIALAVMCVPLFILLVATAAIVWETLLTSWADFRQYRETGEKPYYDNHWF